ncbi:cation diffusion facilitator family transporter [Aestuariispira ectoiniformans]|uniref:cation diffusion facilitator family transporter n=1 Tax=Aestuariispira ectoiniformans TaxID=2775080 RepID=UPI00223AE84E|nr:cation diffusion facilitator family transporter [Aestuariispira ectoiniformans]
MAGGSKKVVFAAIGANAVIAAAKFTAAVVTGSAAMFSEAIHSTVDTGNQLLLLLGLYKAAKPADREHPFGYSKELYFWSFVVALLIFAVGAGVSIYEGIHKIIAPHAVENPLVNFVVLGIAAVVEGGAWLLALKEFNRTRGRYTIPQAVRRTKDPAVLAVLLEDSAAILGLVIAFGGVAGSYFLNMPVLDGVASVGIGLLLAAIAVVLAVETKALLIGEAASPEVVAAIRKLADQHAHVAEVNEILTMHLGPEDILVNLSLDFRNDIPAGMVESTVTELERQVKETMPQVRRIFIEVQSAKAHAEQVAQADNPA